MERMREEDDSYLKPGQKDENDSYVGRPKPVKPMPAKPGSSVKRTLPKPMPAKPGMGKGVKQMPAKPGNSKKRALREAMLKTQSNSSSSKPKSGLDNTWM